VSKTDRAYVCEIDGCGKCFARGEHLKRHVRSIHTNDKRKPLFPLPSIDPLTHALYFLAFKCTHSGCDKSFSRHDNLGQHMRIHSNRRR
jgi:uncharacterized Zn-finger protein